MEPLLVCVACMANRATNTVTTTTTPTNLSSRIGSNATHTVTANGQQRHSVRETPRLLEMHSHTRLTFSPISSGLLYPPAMRLDMNTRHPSLVPQNSRDHILRREIPAATSNQENVKQHSASDNELWEDYLNVLREQARRSQRVTLGPGAQHPAYRGMLGPEGIADHPVQHVDPRYGFSNLEGPRTDREPPQHKKSTRDESTSSESDDETSTSDSSEGSSETSVSESEDDRGHRRNKKQGCKNE